MEGGSGSNFESNDFNVDPKSSTEEKNGSTIVNEQHDNVTAMISGSKERKVFQKQASGQGAVIYCRVSTVIQQDEGVSLQMQESICREFCAKNEWTVLHVYKESVSSTDMLRQTRLSAILDRFGHDDDDNDEVKSEIKPHPKTSEEEQESIGGSSNTQLSSTISRKHVTSDIMVVVYSISRFSRNVLQGLEMTRRMRESHLLLTSATELIDVNSCSGEFALISILNAAELESKTISKRVRDSLHKLKQDGNRLGHPEYGYKVTYISSSSVTPVVGATENRNEVDDMNHKLTQLSKENNDSSLEFTTNTAISRTIRTFVEDESEQLVILFIVSCRTPGTTLEELNDIMSKLVLNTEVEHDNDETTYTHLQRVDDVHYTGGSVDGYTKESESVTSNNNNDDDGSKLDQKTEEEDKTNTGGSSTTTNESCSLPTDFRPIELSTRVKKLIGALSYENIADLLNSYNINYRGRLWDRKTVQRINNKSI